jgi:hypothetical protein
VKHHRGSVLKLNGPWPLKIVKLDRTHPSFSELIVGNVVDQPVQNHLDIEVSNLMAFNRIQVPTVTTSTASMQPSVMNEKVNCWTTCRISRKHTRLQHFI